LVEYTQDTFCLRLQIQGPNIIIRRKAIRTNYRYLGPITIIILLCTPFALSAQQDEAAQALINGKRLVEEGLNKWDLDGLIKARGIFERVTQDKRFER
jgi:hypothetical protein